MVYHSGIFRIVRKRESFLNGRGLAWSETRVWNVIPDRAMRHPFGFQLFSMVSLVFLAAKTLLVPSDHLNGQGPKPEPKLKVSAIQRCL